MSLAGRWALTYGNEGLRKEFPLVRKQIQFLLVGLFKTVSNGVVEQEYVNKYQTERLFVQNILYVKDFPVG